MFKRYVYIEGLTNLLGSNGKYLINNDGKIKDVKGNDIEIHRDDENHQIVHCLGWDGERDYRVIDLVALQFKSLFIPIEDYRDVIAFVIDGNKDNTHARNIGYRFKEGKLENKKFSGFYYVPGLTSISINSSAVVIDSKTGTVKNFYITKPSKIKNIKGGYNNVSSYFQSLGSRTLGRHRALCLVFKPYPDDVDSITVNHIDGVPGHDWLDNLEWATRAQNNTHAYVNDLKNQNDHVLVRNVLTGKVTDHYSISEAARVLGYPSHTTIWQRLYKSEFGQVFQDGTQVKLKSDTRDWIIPTDPEKEIAKNQQRIKIQVKNCLTGEIASYPSILDAAKATGVQNGTIKYRLDSKNYSPLFGYQFKEDDKSPWVDFSNDEYVLSLKPNSFKIDGRNLLTGETAIFSSIRACEKEMNNSSIGFFFNKDVQPVLESGWQLKLQKDEWKEVGDFEETIYKQRREMMCKEEATGNITIANNAKQMSEILHLDPKAIREAAFTRGNKLYHGYRFRLGISSEPWPETNLPSQ